MKVLIVGGSGYTGGELLRILSRHKKVDEIIATSRKYKGKQISQVHKNLNGICDESFVEYSDDIDCDFVFLALPHGESMKFAPKFLEKGVKVCDLGADFRINDLNLYEKIYGPHSAPELLDNAIYGLCELFREDIKNANLVANPGCYVTTAILSIYPFSKLTSFELDKIIFDANSGTSGAGANPTLFSNSSEVIENLKPYKLVGHRHEPEINHILEKFINGIKVGFSPTLTPNVRGISGNTHIFTDNSLEKIQKAFSECYDNEYFIRLVEQVESKAVSGTNFVDIGIFKDDSRCVIATVLDNLTKGASGQAVQNMNLMMGFKENEGLDLVPCHP
jgi:N-acetyl-gamma-glutamyl-phosphate reductase